MTPHDSHPVRTAYAALTVFAVAFALRFAVALPALVDGDWRRFERPDTPGYLIPALALARGETYPGTGRVPGFPFFASWFLRGDSSEDPDFDPRPFAVVLCAVGALAAVVVFLAGACRSYRTGIVAGALYAFDLTAVANAPMLLTDTLFGLFAAVQFLLFMLFWQRKLFWCFPCLVLVAALGTLIRPINILWIVPALALLWLDFDKALTVRKKVRLSLAAVALFWAVLLPWMFRNMKLGAGFTIDTNTGAVYHQNGAMLMAEVNNTDFESEKARLLAESEAEFSDTARYPDEASREAWRLRRYREMVFSHPLVWLRQSASWKMLIPDAPTFWELCGMTSSGRGTMGVVAKYGFFAGVRHYFGGSWKMPLLTVLLLLPTVALYAFALWMVICDICRIRERWYALLVFLAFAEYYLLLPGAITAPRYQIPALPVLCVMAAAFLTPAGGKTPANEEKQK